MPRQHCTFHVQRNIRLRLWQDGVAVKDGDALADRLLAPILTAPTRGASLVALERSITLAEDNGFEYAAQHLRNVGHHLSTWQYGAPLPPAVAHARTFPAGAHDELAGADHA